MVHLPEKRRRQVGQLRELGSRPPCHQGRARRTLTNQEDLRRWPTLAAGNWGDRIDTNTRSDRLEGRWRWAGRCRSTAEGEAGEAAGEGPRAAPRRRTPGDSRARAEEARNTEVRTPLGAATRQTWPRVGRWWHLSPPCWAADGAVAGDGADQVTGNERLKRAMLLAVNSLTRESATRKGKLDNDNTPNELIQSDRLIRVRHFTIRWVYDRGVYSSKQVPMLNS